jgi:hypothetical protein
MVMTYLILLVLFAGPVGVSQYLRNFGGKRFSENDLAALTVTSPFAAASSLRMATASNQSGGSMMPTNGPLVPGLEVPVWTAFLMLTVPLCLGLFVVTYLAFRWRWWKAGVTI